MAKKISGYIKLHVPAGKANPSPPIGPALGQRGLNIMEFCKAFNAATQSMEPGSPIPVIITVYADRTFTFITKKATATHMIMKEAGITKGSATTGKGFIGKIKISQLKKIAEQKMSDLNSNSIDGAVKILSGSARALGLEVVEG